MGKTSSKDKEIKAVYDFKEKLGTGSFATVKRLVRKEDKEVFAVKIIRKDKLNEEELSVIHDEVDIMQRIKHDHCVQLYEIFENKKKLYIVMEILTGGELFDSIVAKGNYSEKDAATVVYTVSTALNYLHSEGIVHRDLKPENLIYSSDADDAVLKITDFGLAKYSAQSTLLTTACGTPNYVAPEVLEGKDYSQEVDLWSLGVILYILLCGFPPFYDESTAGLYRQIKRGEYDFPDPYWSDISDNAKAVVKGLLTIDPKKRWTPDQLESNSWVTGSASSEALQGDYTKRIRLTVARRDLRKGIKAVIAINRFARALVKVLEKAGESED